MSKQKNEDEKPVESPEEKKLIPCFVMMPISDQDGYSAGHFDRVYKFIIQPACREAGFEPFRGDEVASSNVIIVDILTRLLETEMAVCDLSAINGNVMYELGIRQAFDKPVALLKDEITTRIFDISSIRAVPYNSLLRFDQVNDAVKKLAKAIDETYKNRGKEFNSLVSVLGINKAEVKSSDLSPEGKAILQAINELRTRVNNPIGSEAYQLNAKNAPTIQYTLAFPLETDESTVKEIVNSLNVFFPKAYIYRTIYTDANLNVLIRSAGELEPIKLFEFIRKHGGTGAYTHTTVFN